MTVEDEIKDYAREIGAAAVGITGPEPLDDALPACRKRMERGFLTGFEEKDLELRFDPRRSLSDVKSIVSVAVPYNVEYIQSSRPKYHGQLARVAWGRDYHVVVSEKMTKIVELLGKVFSDLDYVMMADTGPLLDKIVAWRAGLGWIGKNNTLIVPGVGSWVFLGEILVNKRLQTDSALQADCGRCEECLKACPTRALVEPYMLNGKACLSYLTQTSEAIPEWAIPKLARRIYGCDVCQEVCPYNKAAPKIGDKAFSPSIVQPYPDLIELIGMDSRRYVETIGQTSAEWVGRTVIQRNAILALTDYRDPDTLAILEEVQNDQRPLIRELSQWASRSIREVN